MDNKISLTQAVSEVLIAEKSIKGITYESLVTGTGISRAQIIRFFKGQRSLELAQLESICQVLNLDPFDVLTAAHARTKA